MFKALKLLNHEKHQNFFVHSKDRKIATKCQKMYIIIKEYLKKHFQKERIPTVHTSEQKPLRQKIFAKEVKGESSRMTNNKSSDD